MKNNAEDFESIGDEQLFKMACRFGSKSLAWRHKFIGTLPEIHRRRLYEKNNFESIFVFAQKVGGLSQEQVRRVLNLEKRFTGTPILKKMLVTGEVSINKLARIASIATRENEIELAEKVRVLPKNAVDTFVRDVKLAKIIKDKNIRTNSLNKIPIFEVKNGLFEPKIKVESVPGHRLKLSNEVTEKLFELQKKGIDVNKFLLQALAKREMEIEKEKEEVAANLKPTTSRYTPVKVRRVLQKEHGNNCSIRGCCKKAVVIHHTQPFAMSKIHDPRFLAPLCKEHHAIAHSINVKASEMQQSRQMLRM